MTHDLWLRRAGWLGMVAFVFGAGLTAQAQTKDEAPPKKAKAIAISPEGTLEIEIGGDDIKVTGDAPNKDAKEGVTGKIILGGKEFRAVERKPLPGQPVGDKPEFGGKVPPPKDNIITGRTEAVRKLPPQDKPNPGEKPAAGGSGKVITTQDGRVLIITDGKSIAIGGGNPYPAGETNVDPPIKLSKHYLGIECFPTDAALRAQLNIPDFQGLIVEQVVPDSPAAKAGLQHFDVLLTANDKKLSEISDLIGVVGEAKENEVALKLLRGGKVQTITVKPAKRPDTETIETKVVPAPNEKAIEQGLKWLQQHQAQAAGDESNAANARYMVQLLQPGVMLPTVGKFNELPDDMTITVTRKGKSPAQIVVQQGKETWNVSEKELDKLPENVRGFVGPLVGHYELMKFRTWKDQLGAEMPGKPQMIVKPDGEKPAGVWIVNPEPKKPGEKPSEPKSGDLKPGQSKPSGDSAADKRFEYLQRQIEELREQVRGNRDPRRENVKDGEQAIREQLEQKVRELQMREQAEQQARQAELKAREQTMREQFEQKVRELQKALEKSGSKGESREKEPTK